MVVGADRRPLPAPGVTALSTTWRLAQTTALPQSVVTLYLANPGQAPATATVTLGLSSGSVVPHRVVVPPVSMVAFAASGTPGLPQQTPYAAHRDVDGPHRGGTVRAGAAGIPLAGVGLIGGHHHRFATRWLVPGPGVSPGPRPSPTPRVSSLAVANSGRRLRVEVARLGGRSAGGHVHRGPRTGSSVSGHRSGASPP